MRRINIIQGENAIAGEAGVIISTLLGSCIAVCLYDDRARVGGMNHFLLGEPGADHKMCPGDMQRYGIHAMELLINGMMARGAMRSRLRAHLYGGANILAGLGTIGSANVAFARRFMETEGISIGHCDLGGASARKIDFMPHEGRSRCSLVSDPIPVAPVPTKRPVLGGDLELF